jgi:hypothetical protein
MCVDNTPSRAENVISRAMRGVQIVLVVIKQVFCRYSNSYLQVAGIS